MNFKSKYIAVAVAVAVAVLIGGVAVYFLFPRRIRLEGFQGTPQLLVGDPETCKIMKNILDVTNTKLEQAKLSNSSLYITLWHRLYSL